MSGSAVRQYIANMTDGATCGFTYVSTACLEELRRVSVRARARRGAVGELVVSVQARGQGRESQRAVLARIPVKGNGARDFFTIPQWMAYEAPARTLGRKEIGADEVALYVTYEGMGAVDLLDICGSCGE
ncbi:hypothetical protein [Alloscardovia macacae]|uniref:hypothetical protein n=1 Tax=Alloscardovia macacae TaxID=1160091 RepID=UPI00214D1784|nr:hypothetical protein [Alloscardovia macacae]